MLCLGQATGRTPGSGRKRTHADRFQTPLSRKVPDLFSIVCLVRRVIVPLPVEVVRKR